MVRIIRVRRHVREMEFQVQVISLPMKLIESNPSWASNLIIELLRVMQYIDQINKYIYIHSLLPSMYR